MKRFENQTVIVTGGARGMGASHTRGFVAEGANVVIANRVEDEGRTLANELGDQAIFSLFDVTRPASCRCRAGLRPLRPGLGNLGLLSTGSREVGDRSPRRS